MQAGFTKYCCFLCLWDSRAVYQHYKQKDWGSRSTFVPGEHSLKENPLVDMNKGLLPPLQIKLGLMKNFVKPLHKNGAAFQHVSTVFPGLSAAKLKEGIFVGPQIREVLNDTDFEELLNLKELRAWEAFKSVCSGFLGNRRVPDYQACIEKFRAKNLQPTLLFVDFTKAFDSIHRGKMELILLAYGLPKETVAAIMILYGNTKVKVRSPDGDTKYFDIVAGVLKGDTLAPYLFIICLDYVLRTSIDKIRENGSELTKKRSKRYPAKTITDADYANDIALLAIKPNQAETLLHSLERAAAGIDLHVNAHKTEYMCYNQTGNITTLEGVSLKLVDKFTYQGSSVLINRKSHRHTTNESMDSYL